MRKIILTGGGSAGHVIPNLALLPRLMSAGLEVSYIGSHDGIERGIAESANVPYFSISSGKLRRYFDVKNFIDIFRVGKGIVDALRILRRLKPEVVFSKGGFVTVPVIMAARILGIKTVIHESDITPGLANRLCIPFSTKICCSFPETMSRLPQTKAVLTGTPLRSEIMLGDRSKGLGILGFEPVGKPIVLVMGGSQGSVVINERLRGILPQLLEDFRVAHLCGKGNFSWEKHQGYAEFEFLGDEMSDVLGAADIIVSRAGANSIFEFLALKKPHLLIPLSMEASRGDQIQNALSFEKQGFSMVLWEEEMTGERLLGDIKQLYASREKYAAAMEAGQIGDAVSGVFNVILETLRK